MGTLVRHTDTYLGGNRIVNFTSMSSAMIQVYPLGAPICFLVLMACDGLSADVRQLS